MFRLDGQPVYCIVLYCIFVYSQTWVTGRTHLQ